MKALIVDDEDICITASSVILSKLGVEYKEASNGKEALEIIQKEAIHYYYFDFVLMDFNMPIMNGIDATKKIKTLVGLKEIRELFVLGLSANATLENSDEWKDCDMDYFLSKPLSGRILLDALTFLLNRKK